MHGYLKKGIQLLRREEGPLHYLDDEVDWDQYVVNKELSLSVGIGVTWRREMSRAESRRGTEAAAKSATTAAVVCEGWSESSVSIALICTATCRIPSSASTTQRPGNGDLILLWRLVAAKGRGAKAAARSATAAAVVCEGFVVSSHLAQRNDFFGGNISSQKLQGKSFRSSRFLLIFLSRWLNIWAPQEQKMLKGHLPGVIYHLAKYYTKIRRRSPVGTSVSKGKL